MTGRTAGRRKQEAQLMMTNLRDAFRGHSRSQNMVSFEMLGMITPYAIVTVFFPMFDFKKCRDLEIRVRGQGH